MPIAKTKADLIAVTETEYDKLRRVIDPLSAATACADHDGSSIKDVIGHRAHWVGLFLGWYQNGQSGGEVHFPAPGYNWADLKRYNADLKRWQAGLTWEDVCDLLAERHGAFMSLLASLSDTELYGEPMRGAKNTWTTGRWAEANGASHYRSATKFTRSALRAIAA